VADVPPAPMPDDAKVTCPGGETCHWWNPKTDTWVHENVGKYRDYCFPSHAELHADGQVVEMVSLEAVYDALEARCGEVRCVRVGGYEGLGACGGLQCHEGFRDCLRGQADEQAAQAAGGDGE